MTKFENGKKYALVSAICFLAYFINTIVRLINYDIFTIGFMNVIYWSGLLGLSVGLFLKSPQVAAVAAGLLTIQSIYDVVRFSSLLEIVLLVLAIVELLAPASLVVVFILMLKRINAVKKIWFIPGAFNLLLVLYLIVTGLPIFSLITLFNIVFTVALFLAGLWAKKSFDPIKIKEAPVNEYATTNSPTTTSVAAPTTLIGGADKLKMYKDLLDSGVITEEEFQAKKEQLLKYI